MNQTFLSLGAVAIFMYLSVNIHKSYVQAARQTVGHQEEMDAINYGLTLSDELYSQSFNYDSLDTYYGNLDNLSNSSERKNFITPSNDTLAATIELSEEEEIILGATGRLATINVYRIDGGQAKWMSEQVVSLVPFNGN